MTIDQLVDLLNGDLRNEYKHMHFYLHASFMLGGIERLFYAEKLAAHAADEMEHVKQFATKIRSFGHVPADTPFEYPTDLTKAEDILKYALEMEKEVVKNYHERRRQAEQIHADTGRHYDLVVFLENQIEDSQEDVDELVNILNLLGKR